MTDCRCPDCFQSMTPSEWVGMDRVYRCILCGRWVLILAEAPE